MVEKLTKLEIARRQIHMAIELFFAKKDLCSVVTLAAAGEEILGRLLRTKGKQPTLDRMISDVKGIMQDFSPSHEIPNNKYMVDKLNYARNHLKHLDDPALIELELDLFSAALGMLNRAVENYEQLNGDISEEMKRFRKITDRIRENFGESA